MRRLGTALGVEAMSLYHHIPSKSALFDGLVSTVLSEVPLPVANAHDWEAALRQGFADFRRVMLAHPALFPVVCSRPASDRESLTPIARAFALLEAAGLPPREIASAWNVLLAYSFGFILCELNGHSASVRGDDVLRLIHEQTGADFAALQASWATVSDWDDGEEFDRGLDVVVAGLRTRLGEAPRVT